MISRSIVHGIRNVSEESCKKLKKKIHVPKVFFPENHAVYEIMWRNVVEPARSQMAHALYAPVT